MNEKEEMNPAWLFIDKNTKPLSLWAKCKNCGEWNLIRKSTNSVQGLPSAKKLSKPIIKNCPKCGAAKGILIERVWFARRGMREPKA